MTTRFVIRLLLFAVSAMWAVSSHAAWYKVEVIVFAQLEPDTDGELWYVNPGLPDRSRSIELVEAMEEESTAETFEQAGEEGQALELKAREERVPYQVLAAEAYRLDGVQRILKLSREYRPLLHVAWQQAGLDEAHSRAVHIQQFEEPEEVADSSAGDEEPFDVQRMEGDQFAVEEQYQVLDLIFDGTIRLRSTRFLHVDVDIAYFPEEISRFTASANDNGTVPLLQQADYVRLRESRRIRLNEVHYFDHPLFGVLLRVSRLP